MKSANSIIKDHVAKNISLTPEDSEQLEHTIERVRIDSEEGQREWRKQFDAVCEGKKQEYIDAIKSRVVDLCLHKTGPKAELFSWFVNNYSPALNAYHHSPHTDGAGNIRTPFRSMLNTSNDSLFAVFKEYAPEVFSMSNVFKNISMIQRRPRIAERIFKLWMEAERNKLCDLRTDEITSIIREHFKSVGYNSRYQFFYNLLYQNSWIDQEEAKALGASHDNPSKAAGTNNTEKEHQSEAQEVEKVSDHKAVGMVYIGVDPRRLVQEISVPRKKRPVHVNQSHFKYDSKASAAMPQPVVGSQYHHLSLSKRGELESVVIQSAVKRIARAPKFPEVEACEDAPVVQSQETRGQSNVFTYNNEQLGNGSWRSHY